MERKKKRRGDRKDAYLVRDLDSMHIFMPYLMPNRADNEAVMNELVDLTAIDAYLERKNADHPDFKYTMFHVICAALAKTITLRPKMNRFIAGRRVFERKVISLSFVVKKQFRDDAQEAFAIVEVDRDSDVPPLEQIYTKVREIVHDVRERNVTDGTTDYLNMLTKFPRFILRIIVNILFFLDFHGKMPAGMVQEDPDYSTVFISNLGSINMTASYHHLVNWGTNSFFVIVGEKHKHPFFNDDGTYEMRNALEMGLTIDERIADGFYFAQSIKILRKILQNPDILEYPVTMPIEEIEKNMAAKACQTV
jgi:pyruvate/2-oxoglutarate dehydrogenase complex dihydrolipoamide acyltransferase (E2) component